jgi:hypothetical protein
MTNPRPSSTRWRIAIAVVVMFAAVAWLVAVTNVIKRKTGLIDAD